jgi:osmotically-inducible protein OsmY
MSLADGNWVLRSGRRGQGSSDQAMEDRVRTELVKSPYGAIRAVSCRVNDGVLTLSGSVPSYYLKQIAQRLALNALGEGTVLVNQLQVES